MEENEIEENIQENNDIKEEQVQENNIENNNNNEEENEHQQNNEANNNLINNNQAQNPNQNNPDNNQAPNQNLNNNNNNQGQNLNQNNPNNNQVPHLNPNQNNPNNNQAQNQNQIQNQNNANNNNNINNANQQEAITVNIIKSKIKFLREKYNFSLQYNEIMNKLLKAFQDQTYTKLNHSINEGLNFISFFKESAEIYSKFAKQILETNNLMSSSIKEAKLNDNILLDVMQKTQNSLYQNINKISNSMKQNIVNKGPLSKIQDKINKIEQIKKENFDKFKGVNDSKKKLQKALSKYEKIFESYSPSPNMNNNNNNRNNNIPERPRLIDTPDFIIIIKYILSFINKLILDINLYIIDTKDTFYKINGLYVEINNLVKNSVLIYIQECKNIFNLDLTKNFEEIENYYKKLDEKSSDKIFKLEKIFNTKESEDFVFNILQQYYMLLSNSNSVKKQLLADRNKFSIKNNSNLFLFFEWLISVSPQPTDLSIQDLLLKKMNIKRDPGIFSSWKDAILVFTKQQHCIIFDKPGTIDDLVKVFELDKTSFRKKADNKKKFLFELIANRKGKIMDFKGSFLFDGLCQENIDEIPNLVYSAYNL